MSFLSRGRGASSAARGAQLTRGRNLKGELVTQAYIEEKMAEAKAAEAAEAAAAAEATRMAAEEAAEATRMAEEEAAAAAEATRMEAEEAERAAKQKHVREYIKTSGQRRLPLKIFENPDTVMSAPLVHAPSYAPFYDPFYDPRFDNPLYDSRYPNTMFADTTHFPDARVNPNILKKSQEIYESKMGGTRKKKKYTQTRQKKQQRRRRHRRHSTRKYKK